jgi:hypothetical protein
MALLVSSVPLSLTTMHGYYNEKRPHSSHGLLTPGEAYDSRSQNLKAAA